jgi:hypothetical protein
MMKTFMIKIPTKAQVTETMIPVPGEDEISGGSGLEVMIYSNGVEERCK